MIKKIGRLVMLGVAIAFIVFSIFRIKGSVDLISLDGWNIILDAISSGDWSKMTVFTDLGWGVLYILVGLSALVVAIKGRAGFWTFIASGIMLGFFIFNLVVYTKGGKWQDYFLNLSLDIICQLIYVVGILLVMYGNHREKNELKRLRKYKREHPDN